eukprot:scaffold4338_cov183-Ochromonas_danica.AAC.13
MALAQRSSQVVPIWSSFCEDGIFSSQGTPSPFPLQNTFLADHLYYYLFLYLFLFSGAEGVQSLRGPFDVMNIACLLRLSEEQARASVTTLPLVALRHAEARKHKFLSVRVVSRSSYEETCARLATELVKRKADSVQEEEQKKSKKHHQRKGRGGKRKQSSSEESTDDEDDDEKEEEEEEEGITPTVSAKRSDLVVGSKRGQEEMKEEEQEEDDDGFLKL